MSGDPQPEEDLHAAILLQRAVWKAAAVARMLADVTLSEAARCVLVAALRHGPGRTVARAELARVADGRLDQALRQLVGGGWLGAVPPMEPPWLAGRFVVREDAVVDDRSW